MRSGVVYAANPLTPTQPLVLVADRFPEVAAFDAATGARVWDVVPPRPSAVQASPALSPDGRTVYVANSSDTLYAFDVALRRLIERDGVIGAALDAWMLAPGWIKGTTSNTVVGLAAVADQIDHVCQLAGNSRHAAIGSDLDGGYGWEQCPHDLASIAGLVGLAELLRDRGYGEDDVQNVLWRNWARLFRDAWGHQAS